MEQKIIFVANLKILARLIIIFCIILVLIFLLKFDRGLMVVGMPGIIAYLVTQDEKFDTSGKAYNFFTFIKRYILSIIAISTYIFIEIIPQLQTTSIEVCLISIITIILGVSLCITGAYFGLNQGEKLVKIIFTFKNK
jgi:hypothetical protein